MSTVILGIGCDRNTCLQTLETAVKQALAMVNLTYVNVQSLASIDKKSDETGLLALSEKYHWPICFFTAEQLRKVEVPNPSAIVMKYVGTPAVAEAAALLSAQTGIENLILEKYKYRGKDDKNATVSIVTMINEPIQ